MKVGVATYVLSGYEAWHCRCDLLRKLLCLGSTILDLQLICQDIQVLNGTSDAPPCSLRSGGVALAVYTEGCIILTLNQEIASLVAVRPPGLY